MFRRSLKSVQYARSYYRVSGCPQNCSARILRPLVPIIRNYSDGRKDDSIEEFKKGRKEYVFGKNLENPEGKKDSVGTFDQLHSNTGKTHDRMGGFEEPEEDDIQKVIEKDPRLINLKPGSPDYKYQMHLIHMELDKQQKKNDRNQEFYERLKGLAFGVVAIVGVVGLHQLAMNYEYVKNSLMHGFTYYIDDTKVADTSDPSKNTKKLGHLVNKISEELSDKFVDTLRDSKIVTGVYLFGSENKLPMRLNFFDGMLIKDLKIHENYIVVIDNKGKVYEVAKREPTLKKIPFKVEKCEITDDSVYLLTNKGKVVYFPRVDKPNPSFKPIEARNWMGLKRQQDYNILNTTEATKDISSGACHLLLLSKSGKLYVANTSDHALNQGQFGIPQFSPYEKKTKIPTNKVFELTLANHQIITKRDGSKSLISRKFDSIASGKYHNVAADVNGNIWAWGRNVYGECGTEVSYENEYIALPRTVFRNDRFFSTVKNSFSERPNNISVEGVHAADETSFVHLCCHFTDSETYEESSQSVVLAFGNGLKGQLGVNRFLHVCPEPQVIKSLVNLKEYDEKNNKNVSVNIKDISAHGSHVFITLENSGDSKDVVAFGDNEFGQLGNGKNVRSSKPIQLPQLIEPKDLEVKDLKTIKKVAKNINDTLTKRLQLLDGHKIGGKTEIEQVIVAGGQCSAIYYRCK